MCVSLAAMSAFELFQIGATAFSAISQISQGQQQQQYHEFQAAQAAADAQAEREAGQVRAQKTRRAGRYQQSEARASLAASGVEIGAGTPMLIETEIDRRTEADALQDILLGSRRGSRLDQESQLQDRAGGNALAAGYAGGFRSVLAGGAEMIKPGWRRAPVENRYPDLPDGP